MKRLRPTFLALMVSMFFAFSGVANAATVFYDDFNNGARPEWGNEVGSWYVSNGVYNAQYPNNFPPTYSSITSLPNLTDFTVSLDINGLADGGIFLRSTDNYHGVSFAPIGAWDVFHWHILDGGWGPALNQVRVPGLLGSNVHIDVVVEGNTYSAYLNHSSTPITTLVTDRYSSGKVALYDFSGETFDNVSIQANVVPEPATVMLLSSGLLGLIGWKKKQN